jgi:hypothetical protein
MNDCVSKFKLFSIHKKQIKAERVDKNLNKMRTVSDGRAAAGRASGEARRRRKQETNNEQTGTNAQQNRTNVQQKRTKTNRAEQSRAEESRSIEYDSIIVPKDIFAIASNKSTAIKLVREVWSYLRIPEGFDSKTESEKLYDKASNLKKVNNPKKYIEAWLLNFGQVKPSPKKINGHGQNGKQVGNDNSQGYDLLLERSKRSGKKRTSANQD